MSIRKKENVLQAVFRKFGKKPNLFKELEYSPPIEDALADLQNFIDTGGQFNSTEKNKRFNQNHLMLIAETTDARGLDIFFKNGGQIDPEARDWRGATEAMCVIKTGYEGMKMFVENGGNFSTPCTLENGFNQAMYCFMKEDTRAIDLFIKNGGRFDPDAKTNRNETEAMFAAKYAGAEGLKKFVEYGGVINHDNPKENAAVEKAFSDAHKQKTQKKVLPASQGL